MARMKFIQRKEISFFYLLFLLNGVHFVPVTCQSLSSDLPADEPVCPRQVVTFTCETRGSPILAWTSDEYIERGGTQLEFATFNDVNDTRISPVNSNTIATLVANFDENGVSVLRSTLRIRALSGFLNSSVNCLHIGDGTMSTSRVLVIGDAAEPRFRHANLWLRSMNDTNGTCIAELSWNSPTNIRAMDILHYEINFYGRIVATVTDDGNEGVISAVYIYDEDCDCTNLNEFSVRAVNKCNRPGARSSTVLGPPKPLRTLDCDSLDLTTTPPPDVSLAFKRNSFSDSEFYGILAALIVMAGYSVVFTIIVAGGMIIIVKKKEQKPVAKSSQTVSVQLNSIDEKKRGQQEFYRDPVTQD